MQSFTVPTPLGEITVQERGSYDSFPGVIVFVNGNQVATVEYSNTTDQLQAAVWQGDYYNDPVADFEFPDLARR